MVRVPVWVSHLRSVHEAKPIDGALPEDMRSAWRKSRTSCEPALTVVVCTR